MRHGRHPSTLPGELWRAAMQGVLFSVYAASYGGRRWMRGERQAGLRPQGLGRIVDTATKDISGSIGFVLSSIAFGDAAAVLKDLSKGRMPRDPQKLETWMSAVLQSGGAGIFGDMFLGTSDRFGNSAVSALAGPVAGSLGGSGGITQMIGEAARGDVKNLGHDAARWAIGHSPFVNLWYTRAAVDWLSSRIMPRSRHLSIGLPSNPSLSI